MNGTILMQVMSIRTIHVTGVKSLFFVTAEKYSIERVSISSFFCEWKCELFPVEGGGRLL